MGTDLRQAAMAHGLDWRPCPGHTKHGSAHGGWDSVVVGLSWGNMETLLLYLGLGRQKSSSQSRLACRRERVAVVSCFTADVEPAPPKGQSPRTLVAARVT